MGGMLSLIFSSMELSRIHSNLDDKISGYEKGKCYTFKSIELDESWELHLFVSELVEIFG